MDVSFANDWPSAQGRNQLSWLREAVLREILSGAERGAIHQANLMPPTLAQSAASVHLAYLLLRGNAIDRLFDQNSGYWQNGLQGLDALTEADRGALLVDYLGASESQIVAAVKHMVRDGRHELAAATLRQARTRLPSSERLTALNRDVYLRLMDKTQDLDPFRFFIYGAQIDMNTRPIDAPTPAAGSPSPRPAGSIATAPTPD